MLSRTLRTVYSGQVSKEAMLVMADIVESLEPISEYMPGCSTGPAWPWDEGKNIAGHMSVTFYEASTGKRRRGTFIVYNDLSFTGRVV